MILRERRFEKQMDPRAARFISSLEADLRIYKETVLVNMAHVLMLYRCRLLKRREAATLLSALRKLYRKDPRRLALRPELEDIHVLIEEEIIKAAGPDLGGKLHTAKSRNDQVVAAIRMRAKRDVLQAERAVLQLVFSLVNKAAEHLTTLMPGYTHLQVAEPTTFAHYLGAYAQAFLRDAIRLENTYHMLDSSPMGACALSGTSFPINRKMVADLLGFVRVDTNTMDAVGSRDWLIEPMSALAITMVDLSRLAEDFILMSSGEFGFLDLPEELSSTSSIMPQKKNQVVAELVRSKAALVIGNLTAALSLVRGVPQSYNLDFQDLTPLLWSSVDATEQSLVLMAELVRKVKPNEKRMRAAIDRGFAIATELANVLARKHGVPFRKAYQVVAYLTRKALESGKTIHQISLLDLKRAAEEVLQKPIPISQQEFNVAVDPLKTVQNRRVPGGPSPPSMRSQLAELRARAKKHERFIATAEKAQERTEQRLLNQVRRLT